MEVRIATVLISSEMYLHVSCTYLANNGNRSYCCRYHNEPMIRLWGTRGMDAIRDQEVQFHEKKALGKTTSTHNAYWSDEGYMNGFREGRTMSWCIVALGIS